MVPFDDEASAALVAAVDDSPFSSALAAGMAAMVVSELGRITLRDLETRLGRLAGAEDVVRAVRRQCPPPPSD